MALGIGLILLSTLFTALQDAIFKYSGADMTLWQLYVLRSVLLIPMLLAVGLVWGEGLATCTRAFRPWAMVRAMLFVLMYFSMYSAITVLPLSTVAAGVYTAPLFVAALSGPLVGEPVRWHGRIAIAMGFIGVLVVLRPGTEAFSWLMLMPVVAGLFYALSAIVTRTKCRSMAPPTLAMSLGIALLLTGLVASAWLHLWQPSSGLADTSPFLLGQWGVMELSHWGVVVMLAVLMVGNGLVLPAAYQSAPTAIIATFDYSYLIFATLIGVVFFLEIPDLQTIIGMGLIAGAGLVVASG